MNVLFDICCGIFWSLAYAAAIIIGFRNRTHCIPAFSICMNFSWELLVVLNRLRNGAIYSKSFYIQLAWLLLDLGIIITWQLYRRKERLARVKDLCCFAGVFLIVYLWAYVGAGWETSVFVINLAMSVDFVIRVRKDSAKWTSLFIAVTKALGTLAATLLNGLVYRNDLVLWLGGLCMIVDIYYILLIGKGRGKKHEIL